MRTRDSNSTYADVDVSDTASVAALQKAAIAELKLDAAPNRVRLLLEVQGQAPSPLDSCKSLKEQAIVEGSRVQVELLGEAGAQQGALSSVQSSLALLSLHDNPAASPLMQYWGA